jgi:hypothetical protein
MAARRGRNATIAMAINEFFDFSTGVIIFAIHYHPPNWPDHVVIRPMKVSRMTRGVARYKWACLHDTHESARADVERYCTTMLMGYDDEERLLEAWLP